MGIISVFRKLEDKILLSPKVIYFTVSMVFYGLYLFRAKFITGYLHLNRKQYGDISAIMALASFAFMAAWGTFADALGRHRLVLALLCIALVGSFELNLLTAQISSESLRFYASLLVFSIYSMFASGIQPLTDYLTLRLLSNRPGFSRDMYGRQRMWGTISYGFTTFVVGWLIQNLGIASLFYILPIFCAISVLLLFAMAPADDPKPLGEFFTLIIPVRKSKEGNYVQQKSPQMPLDGRKPDGESHTNLLPPPGNNVAVEVEGEEVVGRETAMVVVEEEEGLKKKGQSPMLQLLKNPSYMFMLFVVFMAGCARTMMTSFLGMYWQDDMQISEKRSAVAANSGIVLEVIIFFFGLPLVRLFGTYWLLIFAQIATVVRCWAYYVLPANPDSFWIVCLIELLKGVAFGCTQLSGVKLASEAAPKGLEATAQALYTAIYSQLPAVLTALAGGRIYHTYGGQTLFLITAVISSAALVLFVIKYIADGSIRIPGTARRKHAPDVIHVKPSVTSP